MSNIDSTQWNTRERATSSDLNRATKLLHRALAEAVSYLASGATKKSGCFGDSFIATPAAGTMKTVIGPGLALWSDSTQVYPESSAVWIESREIREVTHDVGDPQARYDVIEMRPGQLVSSTQPRDVFDPVTGAFTVQNLTKEVKSYPEFRIVKGTPSATPSIPAGSSGWMPIAYVLVASGAVTLDPQGVVYCRPILAAQDPAGAWATPAPTRHATRVKGGGVIAAGGSLAASVANDMTGRFPGYYVDFRLNTTATLRVTTMTWDGGGLPGADGVVYFYVIPPPYPAGYEAHLAGREIWTPDTTMIYTNNGGFYTPTRQEGCIIVASSTAPANLTNPAGYATGNATFNNLFFSAAASNSDREKWVYIGAASFEAAGTQLVTQRHIGRWTATQRKTKKSFFADLPIGAPIQYSLWSEAAGDPVVRWPVTAREIEMQVRAAVNAAGNLFLSLYDDVGNDAVNEGMLINVFANNAGVQLNVGGTYNVLPDSSGRVTIKTASATGAASAVLIGKAYKDTILDLR